MSRMPVFMTPPSSTNSSGSTLPSKEEDASSMSPPNNLKLFHPYLARRGMPVLWGLYAVKVSEFYLAMSRMPVFITPPPPQTQVVTPYQARRRMPVLCPPPPQQPQVVPSLSSQEGHASSMAALCSKGG